MFVLLNYSVSCQALPFEILPSGHIIVDAIIEGNKGKFIFDTGGGINLFFDDFAKKLSHRDTCHYFTGFRATGERFDLPLLQSKEVHLANKIFRNVPFTTTNISIENIDGLIALPMLAKTAFVIDYDKKEIRWTNLEGIKQKKALDLFVTSTADNTLDIFIEVLLNEKHKVKVLLDTGAGNNSFWLNARLLDILGMDRKKMDLKEKTSELDPNYITKIYTGSISTISTSYCKVTNPTINFIEGMIYEGKTSLNWLGHKIGIDIENKKLYILE